MSSTPVATTRITFDDEFNSFSNSPDGSFGNWMTSLPYGGEAARTLPSNNEAEWYSDPSIGVNPFSISGGVLSITAAPAAPGSNPYGLPYTSGVMTTIDSFSQTYGYFEFNAKVPVGQGTWPALWMLPTAGYTSELDIMEHVDNDSTIAETVHGRTVQDGWGFSTLMPTDGGFHTYGVDWAPDFVTYYLDGVKIGALATPPSMTTPMYLIANLAIGGAGSWPGAPDGSTQFPVSMQIDSVRAYATANTTFVGGSASIPVGASPPPPTIVILPASPDNTVVVGTAGSLTDAHSNVWSITAGGQVAVNGQVDSTTSRVTELAYEGGKIWQENADNLWWDKTLTTDAWGPIGGTATSPVPVAPVKPTITYTNEANTSYVKVLDASTPHTYTGYGATFAMTAPGVATVTLTGWAHEAMQFVHMNSVNLTAGWTNTTVTADSGTNTFIAGKGVMDVTGGTGANNYLYHAGNATLTIEDFSAAKDTLKVDAALKSTAVIGMDGHGGTLLTFGSVGHSVDLKGLPTITVAGVHWV